jgi:hypothetical protein
LNPAVKYKIMGERVNVRGLEPNITHQLPVYSDDENKMGEIIIPLKKGRRISECF